MLRRILFALMVVAVVGSLSNAQDVKNPPRGTDFATVGRPPKPTALGGRCFERMADHLDRHPCCGYGKVNTDMGVPGYRSTLSFYWGGACEFFREGCQRSTVNTDRRYYDSQGVSTDMYGNQVSGCKSCGQ